MTRTASSSAEASGPQLGSRIRCAGCGAEADPLDPHPFRCPNADGSDDTDHVLVRRLDPPAAWLDDGGRGGETAPANPFVRFRGSFHSFHVALGAGMTDAEYVALVEDLDDAVERVDGRGFRATPFGRSPALSDRLGFAPGGGVWVKDETGGVAGSHKARHLMGLMVHLLVTERVGLGPVPRPELAIASCGNAALAAATVATAAAWPLRVFVPTDGDPAVLARLEELGAPVTVCPRRPGVAGDPTVHRLREALRGGALPFTCQGNENGLAIEGGLTLAYEIAADLATRGIAPDRLVVQVGGGALASACAQGLREAVGMGMLPRMPAIHAVQTEAAAPLARAHRLLAERIAALPSASLGGHLADAATHRSSFMWPWEAKPQSVANGILDDETYDWLAVVRAMLESGGGPVVVGEDRLLQANRLAGEATGIPVDHTGSAGLAGLLELLEEGRVGPRERVVVLFTGVRR